MCQLKNSSRKILDQSQLRSRDSVREPRVQNPTWRPRGLSKWVKSRVISTLNGVALLSPTYNRFTKSPGPPSKHSSKLKKVGSRNRDKECKDSQYVTLKD